jgi:hypothetical protein
MSPHVRVVHCSPDAPAVTVSIAGDDHQVAVGEATDYVQVGAGTTEVGVSAADDPGGGRLVTESLGLGGTDVRTVLVVGRAASLRIHVLKDDVAPGSNYAYVRFVNAAPDAPALDFVFGDAVVDGDEVLSKRIGFGQNGVYRQITPGTHGFDLGVDTGSGSTFDSPGLEIEYETVISDQAAFEGGNAYTVVALGTDEGEYRALVLTDGPD